MSNKSIVVVVTVIVIFGVVALFRFASIHNYYQEDFFDAAQTGTVQDVEFFLRRGTKVNAADEEGFTAYLLAAANNPNVEILKYLDSRGADIHAKTHAGFTAYLLAAANNPNVDILKYLASQGADIHAKTPEGFMAYLLAAANNPNVDILKYLASQGADIHAKTPDGFTAYLLAAYGNSNVDVLEYLESRGADIHAKTHDGYTAYPLAVFNNPNAHILTYLDSKFQNAGSQYKTVQGTGSGANRNEALLAAKHDAIKNAVGERLTFIESVRSHSTSFSDDKSNISVLEQSFGEDVQKRVEAIISDVKILRETQRGGLLQFTIEAKVRID